MERPTDGVSLVASIDASLTVDAPITIARGCDGNKSSSGNVSWKNAFKDSHPQRLRSERRLRS